MEQPPNRPNLPASTPAPGPMGRRNVYATKLSHLTVPNNSSTYPNSTAQVKSALLNGNELIQPDKSIVKIISKLPFEIRETVTSVVNMAMNSANDVHKDLEISRHEIAILRNDLTKKISESISMKKTNSLYEERIKSLEENIEILKDNINARQKFSVKTKSAMVRLSSTNKMLIDALDALQNTHNTYNLVTSQTLGQQIAQGQTAVTTSPPPNPQVNNNNTIINNSMKPNQLSPIDKHPIKGDGTLQDLLAYELKDQKISLAQNDKLRESLLRVAREHYRSMKNADVLETKVMELRETLRSQEKQNRKLKSELDEVRLLLNVEDDPHLNQSKAATDRIKSHKRKHFGIMDEKFQALIDKNVFDLKDGIRVLRRILSRMSQAPSTLDLESTIGYVVAQDTVKMLDCDMISLFIKHPMRPNILHRYTVQSAHHTEIDTTDAKSIATDVIKSGKLVRLNLLSNSHFHPKIDGCHGVVTKRILSLPVYNTESLNVLGCIHVLNKTGNDLFSEIDEVFGLLYADQTSSLLTSCLRYEHVTNHANLLQNLLEASTALFACIPDPTSLTSNRPLASGSILRSLEQMCRELLRCSNVRAFIVSDYTSDVAPGKLVMLGNTKSSSMSTSEAEYSITTAPIHSGIVGHVVRTGSLYQVDDAGFDPYLNPTIDVDPVDAPLVVIPVVDLYGAVIACLELVVGPRSPRLKYSDEFKDQQTLLFIPAAQWLVHQISSPLQYMLRSVGSTVRRPVSTPKNIGRRKGSPFPFDANLDEIVLSNSPSKDRGDIEQYSAPFSPHHSPVKVAFEEKVVEEEDDDEEEGVESKNKVVQSTEGDSTVELKHLMNDLRESREEVVTLYSKLHDANTKIASQSKQQDQYISRIAELEHELSTLNDTLIRNNLNAKDLSTLDGVLANQASSNDNVVRLTKEKKRLSTENKQLESSLVEANSLLDELKKEVAALNSEVKIVSDEKQSTASESDLCKQDNDKLKAELMELKSSAALYQTQLQEAKLSVNLLQNQLSKIKTQSTVSAVDHESQLIEAANKAKQDSDAEWSLKLSSSEQEWNQRMKTSEDSLQSIGSENSQLKSEVEALKSSELRLTSELQAVRVLMEAAMTDSASARQLEVDQLNAAIEKKDAVISILQAQVVRMAEQSIKQSDEALVGVNAPPTETSSPMKSPPPLGRNTSRIPQMSRDPSITSNMDSSEVHQPTTTDGTGTEPSWVAHVDDYNRTYYFNESTGESSWQNPDEPPEQKGDWIKNYDDAGTEYWVNEVTGESAWEVPADSDGNDNSSSSIYDTSHSQYSVTAGNYTIEL